MDFGQHMEVVSLEAIVEMMEYHYTHPSKEHLGSLDWRINKTLNSLRVCVLPCIPASRHREYSIANMPLPVISLPVSTIF